MPNNTNGSNGAEKKARGENTNLKKYFQFGVFFDGTGNDMNQNFYKDQTLSSNENVQLDRRNSYKNNISSQSTSSQKNTDGILAENYNNSDGDDPNDYSNVALLYSSYNDNERNHPKIKEYEVHAFKIYIEGPGTTGSVDKYPLGSGFGKGTGGVNTLLNKAAGKVTENLRGLGDLSDAEFHFHVFGFSRGATLARMFSTMILDENCPDELIEDEEEALRLILKRGSTTVDFLGVFDTVSSIGVSTNNVNEYGLYLHENVKHAMHLCASDEFREYFALTDFGRAVERSNISEFFIPGCHTDVGGTYKTGKRILNIEFKSKSKPYRMYTKSPLNNKKGTIVNITPEGLSRLGWYSESLGNHLDINGNEYEITRTVRQGYNTLPLNLMLNKATKSVWNGMFITLPENISRFAIPAPVKILTFNVFNFVGNTDSGRHVVFPGGEYDSDNYRQLRQSYLNFSANTNWMFWNHASHNGDILCRKVVYGDKGSEDFHYLDGYQL